VWGLRPYHYLETLPEVVRVKLGFAPDLTPTIHLTWDEARSLGIADAVENVVRSGMERVAALARFGRMYPLAAPVPCVAELSKEKIGMLAEKLRCHDVDLFNDAIVIKIGEYVLALSIGFECG